MTRAGLLEEVSDLSIRKQTSLLEINRSKIYYKKQEISFSKLSTMNQIDLIYTEYPIYGYRRIWQELLRRGVWIGRDRVLKYMQYMGIRGIFPGKKTSILNKKHKKYPYLLRDLEIKMPNQVWSMDITYIRVESGFCYLAAIIDWNSRYILSFKFSNTLSTDFCIEALEEALTEYPNPEIFNTDQGVQFTSEAFTKILLDKNIQISMDGKGRALDNIAIERFWRSLKYEDVYVNRYPSIKEAKEGIAKYIDFYNNTRLHSSLGYGTPLEAYAGVLNST